MQQIDFCAILTASHVEVPDTILQGGSAGTSRKPFAHGQSISATSPCRSPSANAIVITGRPLMRPRIYVETTIPSFYHELRAEPDMVARRDWTRQWWHSHAADCELVVSAAVIEELEAGEHPRKQACLDLICELFVLPVEDEVAEIVEAYIDHRVMPRDPRGDALHLALASFHSCHFLLTWTCQHLANANKFEHIRHVNTLLGLFVPVSTTPLELMSREGG